MRFMGMGQMNYDKEYNDISGDVKDLIYAWKKVQVTKNSSLKQKLEGNFLKKLQSTVKKVDAVLERFRRNLYKLPYNKSMINQVKGINSYKSHFVPNVNNPPKIVQMKKILDILSKRVVNGAMNNLAKKVNVAVQTGTNTNVAVQTNAPKTGPPPPPPPL